MSTEKKLLIKWTSYLWHTHYECSRYMQGLLPIHSFFKYLLRVCYVPCTYLCDEDVVLNKQKSLQIYGKHFNRTQKINEWTYIVSCVWEVLKRKIHQGKRQRMAGGCVYTLCGYFLRESLTDSTFDYKIEVEKGKSCVCQGYGGPDSGTEPQRPQGRMCLKNGTKNRGPRRSEFRRTTMRPGNWRAPSGETTVNILLYSEGDWKHQVVA